MLTLAAAFLLAQVLPFPGQAAPLPVPQSSAAPAAGATAAPTAPQRHDAIDVEAGGSNSYLNDGKGRWESAYTGVTFVRPSGFQLYGDAFNSVRFGTSNHVYVLGTSIPTGKPHGVLDLAYAISPNNDVLPTSTWIAGYTLRSGGGWGYHAGLLDRSFSSASAANFNVGIDRRFSNQQLGYFASFATLSRRSGTGVTQGLRWTSYLPMDVVTTTVSAGRSIESTGRNKVGMHDVAGIDVNELHWLDARTAIRLQAGYFSVSRAYQRFLALIGLRVRIGNLGGR